MTRVALATCAELPHGDIDDVALPALLDAEFAVWDDPAVDWAAYDLVVVRSTWDYQHRRDAFLAWARALPRVVNPLAVLEWNTDKRYLGQLAQAGVPVVPTRFVAPGENASWDGEVVIKPSVSAGSRDTARFGPGEEDRARALLRDIHADGRVAMLQPYLHGVDEAGETALMYFGGEFSHAIRKGPILRPGAQPTGLLFAEEETVPREPSAAERALAEGVIAFVRERFGDLAYARVDVVPSASGPVVLELELTEPSLFFAHAGDAAERFARVVSRWPSTTTRR